MIGYKKNVFNIQIAFYSKSSFCHSKLRQAHEKWPKCTPTLWSPDTIFLVRFVSVYPRWKIGIIYNLLPNFFSRSSFWSRPIIVIRVKPKLFVIYHGDLKHWELCRCKFVCQLCFFCLFHWENLGSLIILVMSNFLSHGDKEKNVGSFVQIIRKTVTKVLLYDLLSFLHDLHLQTCNFF